MCSQDSAGSSLTTGAASRPESPLDGRMILGEMSKWLPAETIMFVFADLGVIDPQEMGLGLFLIPTDFDPGPMVDELGAFLEKRIGINLMNVQWMPLRTAATALSGFPIIDLLGIGQERVKDLTHLQQSAPVSIRPRQSRHLPTEDHTDLRTRHSGDQSVEPCAWRGATRPEQEQEGRCIGEDQSA